MTLVADMHYSMHGDPQMSYHNERHSPASSFHSTTERDTLPHASTSSHAHWQSIAHSYLSVPTDAVYTAGSGCSATDSGTSYSWSNFHSPSLTDSCEISQESVHPAHPHSYSALRMHSDYGESSISLPALPPSLSPMPSKSTSPPPNRLPTSHHKSKRRTSQSSSSSSSPTQAHRPSPYSRTAQSPRSKPTIKQEPDEFIMELPSPSPTRHIIPTSPYALANTASTVPLRATQASKEMRAMMGVFRLDPFACMGDGNDGWRYEDEMGPLQEEAALLEWQLEGPGWDVEEGPSLIPFEEEEDLDLLVDGESASGSEIASSGVSSFVRRGSWDVAQDDLDELVYPSPEMITDHFSPTGSMYRGLSRAGLRSDIHQTAITPAFAYARSLNVRHPPPSPVSSGSSHSLPSTTGFDSASSSVSSSPSLSYYSPPNGYSDSVFSSESLSYSHGGHQQRQQHPHMSLSLATATRSWAMSGPGMSSDSLSFAV